MLFPALSGEWIGCCSRPCSELELKESDRLFFCGPSRLASQARRASASSAKCRETA